jgi:chromosome segregation ATPase
MYVKKKFFLLLSAAVSCHATWYTDIYNTLATPIPPISSAGAIAGALGACSLSYLAGKCNRQGETIKNLEELTRTTKELDEEKEKVGELKKEVEYHKARETLIDFSKSDANPHLKQAAEAMVAIDQSIQKTANKVEALNDNMIAKVNNTTTIVSRDLSTLTSEVNSASNFILQAVKGIFLEQKLYDIQKSVEAVQTAVDKSANENKGLQNKNLEDYKKFQKEYTRGIFARLGFDTEPPPAYSP